MKSMGLFGRALLAIAVLLGGIGAEPARAEKPSCCCCDPVLPLPQEPCGCPPPAPGAGGCGSQTAPTSQAQALATPQAAPATRAALEPRREPTPGPAFLPRVCAARVPEALPAQAFGPRGSPPPPRRDPHAELSLFRI